MKNYTVSSGSYKFLHKDYLGSILAISDEVGNKLEQRHFDAWGNLTHFKLVWMGAGQGLIVTAFNFLEYKPEQPQKDSYIMSRLKGTYNDDRQIYSFRVRQHAYLPVEGIGIGARYGIQGTIIIEGRTITVNASGITDASQSGTAFFSGSVTINASDSTGIISFNKTQILSLIPNKSYVWAGGWSFIGETSFTLPKSINRFSLTVKAGYMFKTSDETISYPKPSKTSYSNTYYINK